MKQVIIALMNKSDDRILFNTLHGRKLLHITQKLPNVSIYKRAPPLGNTRTSDLEISWKPTFYKRAMKTTKYLKL